MNTTRHSFVATKARAMALPEQEQCNTYVRPTGRPIAQQLLYFSGVFCFYSLASFVCFMICLFAIIVLQEIALWL